MHNTIVVKRENQNHNTELINTYVGNSMRYNRRKNLKNNNCKKPNERINVYIYSYAHLAYKTPTYTDNR